MAIGLSVPEGLKGSWPNFTHYSPVRSCTVSTFNSFLLVEFGSCAFSCLFWDSSHFSDKKNLFWVLDFCLSEAPGHGGNEILPGPHKRKEADPAPQNLDLLVIAAPK